MKNKELFHKTIGILVNAYLNDTLTHQDCSACAVGNLVAANLGLPQRKGLYSSDKGWYAHWGDVFYTTGGIQTLDIEEYQGQAKKEIDATGYKLSELASIEKAFEAAPASCPFPDDDDETWMFNGLMAVVDVLCEIHEMDAAVKEETKALFVKP